MAMRVLTFLTLCTVLLFADGGGATHVHRGRRCPQGVDGTSIPQLRPPDPMAFMQYRASLRTGSATDGREYTRFALQASQNATLFDNFRKEMYIKRFAGIELTAGLEFDKNQDDYVKSVADALATVGMTSFLERAAPHLMKIDLISRPSKISPLVLPSGTHQVSGTLLRYAAKAAEVEHILGNSTVVNKDIIEIGVGYGGFAAVFLSLHPEIATYTLVDLPEVLNLAHRFLVAALPADVARKVRYLDAAPCTSHDRKLPSVRPADKYDIVLSMSAYAELPPSIRRMYVHLILKKASSGCVTDHGGWHVRDKGEYLPPMFQAAMGSLPASMVVYPDALCLTPFAAMEAQVCWGAIRAPYHQLQPITMGKLGLHTNCHYKINCHGQEYCGSKWKYPFRYDTAPSPLP